MIPFAGAPRTGALPQRRPPCSQRGLVRPCVHASRRVIVIHFFRGFGHSIGRCDDSCIPLLRLTHRVPFCARSSAFCFSRNRSLVRPFGRWLARPFAHSLSRSLISRPRACLVGVPPTATTPMREWPPLSVPASSRGCVVPRRLFAHAGSALPSTTRCGPGRRSSRYEEPAAAFSCDGNGVCLRPPRARPTTIATPSICAP